MFFDKLERSWDFAKTSYSILWDHKPLLLFPILSGIAAIIVVASFGLPLWSSGTIETWLDEDTAAGSQKTTMYVTLFAFYFCSYFVIVFFNSALVACAMQALNGEAPSVGYGLSVAVKRLPQILAWAFVSAVIGTVLRVIENANERAGRFIAGLLGMAWTALTFLVVPVIVVDGVGPIEAFKRSVSTLKSTWGEALMGNFSLGLIGFLLSLPVILVAALLIWAAVSAGSTVAAAAILIIAIGALLLLAAASAAADTIFKALLFSHATGRSVPENIDTNKFSYAFTPKD